MKTVVIALGGNAILKAGQRGTILQQTASLKKTVKAISKMIQQGWRVIITHGNGPQVGNILIQQERGKRLVPMMPLDVCGAQSQGQIGYLIDRELENQLRRDGINKKVVPIVSEVLVDVKDKGFKNPTKPIGPYYSKKLLKYKMVKQKGKGWRRVVASPKPKKIMEINEIRDLIGKGRIVIACGGGGIPVIQKGKNMIGVEAVIDKDATAQLLAKQVKANLLLILTDIDYVYLNYLEKNQKKLKKVSVKDLRQYIKADQFPDGSMLPKIEACMDFVGKGRKAIIASLDNASKAINERSGTIIYR